jgi:hypothetical protein
MSNTYLEVTDKLNSSMSPVSIVADSCHPKTQCLKTPVLCACDSVVGSTGRHTWTALLVSPESSGSDSHLMARPPSHVWPWSWLSAESHLR